MKGSQDMHRLLRQRTWDKDVVLWIGAESVLRALADHHLNVQALDLLDMFDENNLPADDGTTHARLEQSLRAKLRTLHPAHGDRLVLLVRSAALLARYDVGTREFFNWFAGDSAMVVLLVDGIPDAADWPRGSVCDPDRLAGYFKEPDTVKQVFAAKG